MQRFIPYLAVLFLALFLTLSAVVSFVPTVLTSFDAVVHHLATPFQTIQGIQIFQVVTFFGGTVGVVLGTIAVMWFFRHRPDIVARLLIAIIGGSVSVEYLKILFHRVRPEAISGLVIPNTYSFPSGHATSAMILYGFLAVLLYVHARTWLQKVLALTVPLAVILLVGFSRIVLEYHYPSDVLGGLLFGSFWLMLALAIPFNSLNLNESGKMEE